MMKFKFCVLILVLCFISLHADASGGTGSGVIENIYVNNGWTMVHVPTITNNPDNCPSASYFAIRPTDANYITLHSTLLAAFMAEKTVRFWLSGCGGQNNNHPKIVSVWMYK
ncbi:hypothetical protein [Shewanella nanhaiensis]|uniref:Uncharacterized protein n=1 Tax=Shewanella nanhaiensis TaxID=2864872 RepID=A0ABS7E3L9_9GAMM|nr:hypothetical protein [Shewanella nanhaiensis]MBW8184274.1 hypothetical protein [Shewanella nanhaiensis]